MKTKFQNRKWQIGNTRRWSRKQNYCRLEKCESRKTQRGICFWFCVLLPARFNFIMSLINCSISFNIPSYVIKVQVFRRWPSNNSRKSYALSCEFIATLFKLFIHNFVFRFRNEPSSGLNTMKNANNSFIVNGNVLIHMQRSD